MAEVLLFHHAHGPTEGVREFADGLRGAGHTVHTPDPYEARVFGTLEEGIAYAQEVLFHACVPTSEFGGEWPDGLPVQIHGIDADEFFASEGDLDAARALVESTAEAELFLYPGNQHLFADRSLPPTTNPQPRCSPNAYSPSSTRSHSGEVRSAWSRRPEPPARSSDAAHEPARRPLR